MPRCARTSSVPVPGLLAIALLLALPAGHAGSADAQERAPAGSRAIRITSSSVTPSGTTYVLLSGLMGGTAGFNRLESRLVTNGNRVVTIDPYHLAIDSSGVSFAELARYVQVVLAQHGVDSAIVVGHAHGAGVALRLAALDPQRVTALYFLDVGALPVSRTKVFSAALRLAPFISRMPGGRRFLRGRILRGLRENAARHEWLDARTRDAYTEPLLDHIGAVVKLAGRLADAQEPVAVGAVVARVQAPVTLLLGATPHPSGPDEGEITALRPLGKRLRIERLTNVGHFPHEEAPDAVAAFVLDRRR